MRWPKSFALLVLVFFALPARAQDAAPPTTETPAPAQPPPPPQVYDGEQPPPTARPVPARRVPRPAPPPPAVDPNPVGFGFEAATAGFASGNLQGGVVIGLHTAGGALFGTLLNYRDETIKVGGDSSSKTAVAFGLGLRLPLVGSREGLDLALAVDGAYVRVEGPGASAGDPTSKGSGFMFGIGPQIRYWFHRNAAVGYMTQLSHTSISSDENASFSEVTQSLTAIGGTFTLTAGF